MTRPVPAAAAADKAGSSGGGMPEEPVEPEAGGGTDRGDQPTQVGSSAEAADTLVKGTAPRRTAAHRAAKAVAAPLPDSAAGAELDGAQAGTRRRKAATARVTKGNAAGTAAAAAVDSTAGQEDVDHKKASVPAVSRKRGRKGGVGAAAEGPAVVVTAVPEPEHERRQHGTKTEEQAAVQQDGVAPSAEATPAKRRAGGRQRAAGGAAAGVGGGAGAPGASPDKVRVLCAEEAAALVEQPLVDLGELVTGILVRRPSASVKTPYVADVRLECTAPAAAADGTEGGGTGGGGELVLAHAPAMDCAGMVMPGCRLYMSRNVRKEGAPPTATSHAIQVVEDQRPGGGVALVGAHPQLAERMAAELIRRRALAGVLGPYERVETQRTFGATRVDFVLHMADGSRTLLEVKNVVCADYPQGGVPPGRPAVGVYTAPAEGYEAKALFPHGAAKPKIKVVSDRAIKHVYELTQLHAEAYAHVAAAAAGAREQTEDAAATSTTVAAAKADTGAGTATGEAGGDGGGGAGGVPALRCAVLFLVNRSDCVAFRPCHEADPLFAQVLKAAREAGVTLLAYDVRWDGGRAFLGKQLPVVFDPSVNAEYDPVRLQEVLHFNATDPRKNWKSSSKSTKEGGGGKGKRDEVEKGVEDQAEVVAGKAKARGGRKARGRKVETDEEETEEQAEGEEDGGGAESGGQSTRVKRARRGGDR